MARIALALIVPSIAVLLEHGRTRTLATVFALASTDEARVGEELAGLAMWARARLAQTPGTELL